jgi:hypothetical protein
MKHIRTGVLLLVLAGTGIGVQGQPYWRSLGVRIGSAQGISWRQTARHGGAIEGLLTYQRGGLRVTGMGLALTQIGRTDTWWYAGAGGHAGFTEAPLEARTYLPAYGLDVLLGIENVFPRQGISLSFDVKPMLEFRGGAHLSMNQAGATVRWFWR